VNLQIINILLFVLFFLPLSLTGQKNSKYQYRTVAFYNVENLFDTENDTLKNDDDRTPEGKDNWTQNRYKIKLKNIAKVLADLGQDFSAQAPDIIGLCEIENRKVIEDLIDQPFLVSENYGIIHFESPDERGIDVALLYRKEAFIPIHFTKYPLYLYDEDGFRDYTRDQLVVQGYLDGELFCFIINHWPSRSGGQSRSAPKRLAAAALNLHIIDSVQKASPSTKIMSMGDFNDGPRDKSFKRLKKMKFKMGNREEPTVLFHPMLDLHKVGIGSLAYRDEWFLFDQIFMGSNLLDPTYETYAHWKTNVFTPEYAITKKGAYKGYPLRTYANGNYIGGYSDHFPVYTILLKKVND
jgi:hypothetical protein